jgi:predicted O-methyltransferase YrrM
MINTWQIKHFIKHFFFAKRGGHGIHSPFVYALCENVFSEKESFYQFEVLEELRKKLLQNNSIIEVTDLGAGSKTLPSLKRKVSDIVKKGNSSRRQSEFYFKLINYFNCKLIIELGTSLGLNTAYLAKANAKGLVYSIEGCSQLSLFASGIMNEQNINNCKLKIGHFDTCLPELLKEIKCFDLLYIDGNHSYDATMRYFKQALPFGYNNSIIVLDDIYWSEGMTKAWQEITKHEKVTISIDCFYFGIIFFRKEQKQKEHFKIYF